MPDSGGNKRETSRTQDSSLPKSLRTKLGLRRNRNQKTSSNSTQNSHHTPSGPYQTNTDALRPKRSTTNDGTELTREARALQSSTSSGSCFNETAQPAQTPLTIDERFWEIARSRLTGREGWRQFEEHFGQRRDGLTIDNILLRFEDDKVLFEERKLDIDIPFTAGSSFRPREVFDKIVSYLESFKDIGAGIAALDPTRHAPVAWGALQYLVSLAAKSKQINDLVYHHETIANSMFRSAIFSQRYCAPDERLNPCSWKMEKAIVELYTKVLIYLMVAYRWTTKNRAYHALSTLGPSDPVTKAFQDVTDAEVALCKCEDAARVEIVGQMSDQVAHLEHMLHQLARPMSHLIMKVEKIQDIVVDSRYDKILQWISPIQSVSRHQVIKRRHMEGTGGWLFRNPVFDDWQESTESAFLWLQGEMGSGKSMLASLVVENTSKRLKVDKSKQMAFFFCDSTNSNRQKELEHPASVYCDFLKQLLRRSRREIPGYVLEDFADKGEDGSLEQELALDALEEIVGDSPHTIIILDAIDECSPAVRDSIFQDCFQMLWKRAREKSTVLKIFVSSKPETDIKLFFESTYPDHILRVDNAEDIRTFVTKRMDADFRSGHFSREMESKKQDMISGLLGMAHGMFRWVDLALEALHKSTPGTIDATLADLPRQLKGLYHKMYTELEASTPMPALTSVRNTLNFIMYQQVKLTASEILAVVFEDKRSDPASLRERIIRLCSHLVLYDKSTDELRLQHPSVREYLKGRPEYMEVQGHATIAKICLEQVQEYLNGVSNGSKSCWNLREGLAYALTQWPIHLVEGWALRFEDPKMRQILDTRDVRSNQDHTLRRWISRFLGKVDAVETAFAQNFPADRNRHLGIPGISTASQTQQNSGDYGRAALPLKLKLDREFRMLLDRVAPHPSNPVSNPLFAFSVWQIGEIVEQWQCIPEEAWGIMNAEEDTPIEDFCDRLNPEVLGAFIEATTKDALKAVFSRDTSFVLAAVDTKFTSEERIKMIKLMLHYKAKVDLGKGFNVTALHQAAEINSSDIVELLVRHGVCVDAQDPQLRTPLHYACQAGSMAVVKTLLRHGAKLQARTIEGKTPFMTSVSFGKMEIARLILEGSDREAVDSLGCNALLIAAKSAEDKPDMLAFLIDEAQFDINSTNDAGETALHLICDIGFAAMNRFAFIMDKPIDINASTNEKNTALHYAVRASSFSLDIVMSLLEAGISVGIEDVRGMTALHVAIDQEDPDPEVIQLLLNYGADPDAQNLAGESSLHLAVRLGSGTLNKSPDIMSLLVDAGAELNLKTASGATPLDRATFLRQRSTDPMLSSEMARIQRLLEQNGGVRFVTESTE